MQPSAVMSPCLTYRRFTCILGCIVLLADLSITFFSFSSQTGLNAGASPWNVSATYGIVDIVSGVNVGDEPLSKSYSSISWLLLGSNDHRYTYVHMHTWKSACVLSRRGRLAQLSEIILRIRFGKSD